MHGLDFFIVKDSKFRWQIQSIKWSQFATNCCITDKLAKQDDELSSSEVKDQAGTTVEYHTEAAREVVDSVDDNKPSANELHDETKESEPSELKLEDDRTELIENDEDVIISMAQNSQSSRRRRRRRRRRRV
eukprot:gene13689-15116_t